MSIESGKNHINMIRPIKTSKNNERSKMNLIVMSLSWKRFCTCPEKIWIEIDWQKNKGILSSFFLLPFLFFVISLLTDVKNEWGSKYILISAQKPKKILDDENCLQRIYFHLISDISFLLPTAATPLPRCPQHSSTPPFLLLLFSFFVS